MDKSGMYVMFYDHDVTYDEEASITAIYALVAGDSAFV